MIMKKKMLLILLSCVIMLSACNDNKNNQIIDLYEKTPNESSSKTDKK